MSRYRAVFCQIWSDDKFPFLSDDAKLVWFHLYTCEQSTSVGIFKASIEGLAADIRWDAKRYRKGFDEVLERGFIEYDPRLHVVRFPKFFRWNRPANPNVLRGWLKAWDTVPKSELKVKQFNALESAVETWGEGFADVLETFTETLPLTFPKQEQEHEQEQEGKPARARAKKSASKKAKAKTIPPPDCLDAEVWEDLLRYRRDKRAPLTATAWKRIENEIRKGMEAGHDANEMVAEWMNAGWQGFRFAWYLRRTADDATGTAPGNRFEEWK